MVGCPHCSTAAAAVRRAHESLPRRRRGAPGAEARRGGPDHHPPHPPPRQGPRGGARRAQDQVEVRRPPGAVLARGRAVLQPEQQRAGRSRPAALHPGGDDRPVRRIDRDRLRPVHRGDGHAGDGGTVRRERGPAGRPAVPAAGRRPAHAGRRGARVAPGAGRVPAALARGQRVRRDLRRLREMRHGGTQPVLLAPGRRRALPGLPRARMCRTLP